MSEEFNFKIQKIAIGPSGFSMGDKDEKENYYIYKEP